MLTKLSRNVIWLELHQNIDVAGWAEVIAENRPKHRQPRDMVPLTKRLDGAAVDVQVWAHKRLL
jgi:hypothetical protein